MILIFAARCDAAHLIYAVRDEAAYLIYATKYEAASLYILRRRGALLIALDEVASFRSFLFNLHTDEADSVLYCVDNAAVQIFLSMFESFVYESLCDTKTMFI